MIWPQNNEAVKASFDKDIRDQHLTYNYDAINEKTGEAEKWLYEMHFYDENRINYYPGPLGYIKDKIHGGPMAGRINFQQADYQCIRDGELWQCNWLEETGTICSLVYDIPRKKITTLLGFSKGHWENPEAAHGNKRNPEDLARWRKLAEIGKQTDRHLLFDQADIETAFKGRGDLEDVDLKAPTL